MCPRRPRARSAKSPWVQTDAIAHTLTYRSCRTGDNNQIPGHPADTAIPPPRLAGATAVTMPGVQAWTGADHLTRAACSTSAPADSTTGLSWQSTSATQTMAPGAPSRIAMRGPRQQQKAAASAGRTPNDSRPCQQKLSASRVYCSSGTKDTNTAGLHKLIINSIASVNPMTLYSIIA